MRPSEIWGSTSPTRCPMMPAMQQQECHHASCCFRSTHIFSIFSCLVLVHYLHIYSICWRMITRRTQSHFTSLRIYDRKVEPFVLGFWPVWSCHHRLNPRVNGCVTLWHQVLSLFESALTISASFALALACQERAKGRILLPRAKGKTLSRKNQFSFTTVNIFPV